MLNKLAHETRGEFHAASKEDNVNAIKHLMTPDLPINWTDVLMIAAVEGSTPVAKYCIEQGAKVDHLVLDCIICSRSRSRAEDTYRFFVESGHVSVDYDIEWRGTMLAQMADKGQNSLVEYVLLKGADPNRRVASSLLMTALACAAGFKGDEKTLGLLLDHGAKLNGSGALVSAAKYGKTANVKFLLARGADVDEMGIENPGDRRSLGKLGTALHKAVEAGHREVVEVLLAAGANDQLRDAQGRTAVDIDKTRAESILPAPKRPEMRSLM